MTILTNDVLLPGGQSLGDSSKDNHMLEYLGSQEMSAVYKSGRENWALTIKAEQEEEEDDEEKVVHHPGEAWHSGQESVLPMQLLNTVAVICCVTSRSLRQV